MSDRKCQKLSLAVRISSITVSRYVSRLLSYTDAVQATPSDGLHEGGRARYASGARNG